MLKLREMLLKKYKPSPQEKSSFGAASVETLSSFLAAHRWASGNFEVLSSSLARGSPVSEWQLWSDSMMTRGFSGALRVVSFTPRVKLASGDFDPRLLPLLGFCPFEVRGSTRKDSVRWRNNGGGDVSLVLYVSSPLPEFYFYNTTKFKN